MASEEHFSRVGGIGAIVGVAILLIATFAHPMTAAPHDVAAAFAEYAADRFWIVSHLGQLLGVVLITGGLVALAWRLRRGRAGVWAMLGAVGSIVTLASSGALQAVDGIALKIVVDRWADASPEARPLLFEGAFAVRQIEVGLASITILFSGLTAALFAKAFWLTDDAPNWLGWLGMLSGAATVASGIVHAHTGFSEIAMMMSMPAELLLLLWGLLVRVFLFRSSRRTETTE
jgi:hypothetical protein